MLNFLCLATGPSIQGQGFETIYPPFHHTAVFFGTIKGRKPVPYHRFVTKTLHPAPPVRRHLHPGGQGALRRNKRVQPNGVIKGSSTSMPIFNDTERTSTTDLSTVDHSTHVPFSSEQHMLNTLSTNQVVQTYEPVLRISTTYATTKQGSGNGATTEYPISTTIPCPPNMVYAYCTEGQGTCQNPSGVTVTSCSVPMTCVCPPGCLMKDNACVPREECECFIAGAGVLLDGETNVNADCTNRCECQSNVLTCDYSYSSAATCEERGGVCQCYCDDGFKGNGQNCEPDATDCADVYNAGFRQSGVYTIKPTNWPGSPFEAYCNMTHGGGGRYRVTHHLMKFKVSLVKTLTAFLNYIMFMFVYVHGEVSSFYLLFSKFNLSFNVKNLDCSCGL
ncbi:Angiopoietin-1 [Holothuria leucospilota]|uniref:Angiopoietin-1 n=1 Tax=Holothuria leucospilota TaxID=206669 RepID=A0A9Q1CSW4_HOLLE|nr:Angiopoietin-1 [Holothuria leucospilota]